MFFLVTEASASQVRINLRSPSVEISNQYAAKEADVSSETKNGANNLSDVMSSTAVESEQDQHSLVSKISEAGVAVRHSVDGTLENMPRTPRANPENPNLVKWCLEGAIKGEEWCREHLPNTSGLLRLPCQMVLYGLAMLACAIPELPRSLAGDVG